MIHQVVATFMSYPLNGAIHVCYSLQRIGALIPLIFAPPVFHGTESFILLPNLCRQNRVRELSN